MTKKKTEYQVTIGYKAVVSVNVKADNEEEAKKKAMDYFNDYRHFGNSANIEDDNYAIEGCLNMTKTWNMLG